MVRTESARRQSWLGGLFGASKQRRNKLKGVTGPASSTSKHPRTQGAVAGSLAAPDAKCTRTTGAQSHAQHHADFALKTPGVSTLLQKRQKKAQKKARGTSWPLAARDGASAFAAPTAAAAAGSNSSINSSMSSISSSTATIDAIEEDRGIMGGGSAPTSPLGSSPGLPLASLSLGNPKTSSLHKRRQLRRSQKRFVEQPLGPGGVQERTPGDPQPWSPRTCLNLSAAPPDSPVWGFGFGTTATSPTTTTTSPTTTAATTTATSRTAKTLPATATTSPIASPTTSTAAATPATTVPPTAAAATATTATATTKNECAASEATTPSTQGSQPTAESSSWAGTMFGFGDVDDTMEEWTAAHMSPARKTTASFC